MFVALIKAAWKTCVFLEIWKQGPPASRRGLIGGTWLGYFMCEDFAAIQGSGGKRSAAGEPNGYTNAIQRLLETDLGFTRKAFF